MARERVVRVGVLGSLAVEKNVIARRMCGEEAAWARGEVDSPAPRGASLVETFTCPYAYASEATIRVSVADLDAEALTAGSDRVGCALLRGLAALLVVVPSTAPDAESLDRVAQQLGRVRALGARRPLLLLVRVAEHAPERGTPADSEAHRHWLDFAGAMGIGVLEDVVAFTQDSPAALRRKVLAPVVAHTLGARDEGRAAADSEPERSPFPAPLLAMTDALAPRAEPPTPSPAPAPADVAELLARASALARRVAGARSEVRGDGPYAALGRAALASLQEGVDDLERRAARVHDAVQDQRDVQELQMGVAEDTAALEAELDACVRLVRGVSLQEGEEAPGESESGVRDPS